MLRPVGLGAFADAFPERVIDVGIAEQHALTMAAGMAFAGCHPVVALYSTFMNRGFDQLLMDVALHNAPVTVVLDRAGITGDDGPSHNGMWDLSLAAMVPGLRVAVPRDAERLRELLREALDVEGPTLVRYPKGEAPPPIEAVRAVGGADLVYSGNGARTAVVAVGAAVPGAIEAAEGCGDADVLDPRWALPVDPELVEALRSYDAVVTVEDGLVDGGVGSEIGLALSESGYRGRLRHLGIDRRFLPHASRASVRRAEGLTPAAIGSAIESVRQGIRS